MSSSDTFRRNATAAGLVTTATLSLVSVVLQPAFPDGFEQRLAAIDEDGARSAVSAATFALAQLPFVVAVLGVAHLLRGRSPGVATAGASLGVLGAFGHAVFGGIALVYVTMASDEANRAAYAGLMQQVEESPVMVFAAMGLLGTVLGLLLLGVALWRSRLVPRWIPAALWVMLVVEFAAGGLSDYAATVASVLYVIVAVALALWVARTRSAAWAAPVDDGQRELVVTG